jgi:hypothetical protein
MENVKNKVLFVRETEAYKSLVNNVAEVLNTTESQFIRDAINEKIERHAKRNPKVAQIFNEKQARAA